MAHAAVAGGARPEASAGEELERPADGPRLGSWAVAGLWAKHLLCFVLPLTSLGFVVTAPHPWYAALGFVAVIVASVMIDNRAGPATRQPARELPAWPFDVVLLGLAALQIVIVVLFARMVSAVGVGSFDALAG